MRTQPNHKRLTDRFVRTVKPSPKRVLYWDTAQKGLALQVEPTGHKKKIIGLRAGVTGRKPFCLCGAAGVSKAFTIPHLPTN